MNVKLDEKNGGKLLEVQLSGKLVKEDYAHFVPTVERLVKEHGKIRILVEMNDFHGWTAGALWEDIKFDAKHFNDIERLAVVGEKKWEHDMTDSASPSPPPKSATSIKRRVMKREPGSKVFKVPGTGFSGPERSMYSSWENRK